MRKLFMVLAAMMAVTMVNAQTVLESKNADNIYVGINGGVATKTTGQSKWLNGLNSNAGIRVGRYFTPVFGLAVESNAYFSNKPLSSTGTVVRDVNTLLLGTVNLSNWIGGYLGEPRSFDVSAVYGLGWGHIFGTKNNIIYNSLNHNQMISKAGVNLAFHLGKSKAWQVYVEPAFIFSLNGNGYEGAAYNKHRSFFQVNGGLAYHFKNSNGTHHFKIADLLNEAEINALNDRINYLRNQPPQVIEKIVEKDMDVREIKADNLLFITFAQGKYELTDDAKAILDRIEEGKHVQVIGTASPEGGAEINQLLSDNRAKVVADYLTGRGVIVDEAVGKGVQGNTSNRLAVIYIK